MSGRILAARPDAHLAQVGIQSSAALIAVSALAAALVFPVAETGALSPLSVGWRWLVLLGGYWLVFAGWALLYALFLRRVAGISSESALLRAALCHAPLLIALVLVAAVFGSSAFENAFVHGPNGRVLYQVVAKDLLFAAPASLQALVLAAWWRSVIARRLPVIALLVAALALRLSHVAWGLPGLLHPDEPRYFGPATIMVARGDPNPNYFQNPSLMIYIACLVILLLDPQSRAFRALNDLLNLGIQDPRGDFIDMIALRGVSAVAGALTVLAVYLAGKELFGRRAGLLGAALLAFSLLHIRNSHYSTNDVLGVCFLAFSFLFAARLYRRGHLSDYLLAGLMGGLAVSTKYNMGLFPAAILVAHLARTLGLRAGRLDLRPHLPLLAAGAMSVLAFLAGTPYALLDYGNFVAGFRDQLGMGSGAWFGQEAEPSALLYLRALIQGFGLIPLGAALLGTVLLARREPARCLLVLAVPSAYLLFMSTQQLFFARFALPLLPFLALPAGYAMTRASLLPAGPLQRRALAIALTVVALAQPLAATAQHDLLLGRPDTRFQAAAWMDSNLPGDARVAVDMESVLDPKFGWRGYKAQKVWMFWPEGNDLEIALGGEYDYIVISSFGYGPFQRTNDSPSVLPERYREVETRGRMLVQFGPGPGNAEIPYAMDDRYTPFWQLFSRERPGPTIRIYQLTR